MCHNKFKVNRYDCFVLNTWRRDSYDVIHENYKLILCTLERTFYTKYKCLDNNKTLVCVYLPGDISLWLGNLVNNSNLSIGYNKQLYTLDNFGIKNYGDELTINDLREINEVVKYRYSQAKELVKCQLAMAQKEKAREELYNSIKL